MQFSDKKTKILKLRAKKLLKNSVELKMLKFLIRFRSITGLTTKMNFKDDCAEIIFLFSCNFGTLVY